MLFAHVIGVHIFPYWINVRWPLVNHIWDVSENEFKWGRNNWMRSTKIIHPTNIQWHNMVEIVHTMIIFRDQSRPIFDVLLGKMNNVSGKWFWIMNVNNCMWRFLFIFVFLFVCVLMNLLMLFVTFYYFSLRYFVCFIIASSKSWSAYLFILNFVFMIILLCALYVFIEYSSFCVYIFMNVYYCWAWPCCHQFNLLFLPLVPLRR